MARSALTVILSEVSNANEVEGSRTASKIPRPLAGEGKRRGGCVFFCNRRDARVRVQRGLASQVGSISLSEFPSQDTTSVLRNPQKIEMRCLFRSRSFFSDSLSLPSRIPLPVQGEGKRAWRARVRAVATSTSLSTPCVRNGFVPKLLSRLRERQESGLDLFSGSACLRLRRNVQCECASVSR